MSTRITRESGRYFLKDRVRQEVDFGGTAQGRGVPAPPFQKPCREGGARIALPRPGTWQGIGAVSVETAVSRRESRRQFKDAPLSLDEAAFLLWATQGVRRTIGPSVALRTVPSAGARHAFETYLFARAVTGLTEGVYRYLGLEHEVLREFDTQGGAAALAEAAYGQAFVSAAPAVFIWTVIPARMEWRYAEAAYKVIALDAGHVCQNLYLACECIGAGTCAVAAYRQDPLDRFVRVDGRDEFVVYLAPVGKV